MHSVNVSLIWDDWPTSAAEHQEILRLLVFVVCLALFENVRLMFPTRPPETARDCEQSFCRCVPKPLLPEGVGIRQKFNGVRQTTPRSCNNTQTHTGFKRRLQVTAHLDFHSSKACLLWLTRLSRNRIDFQGKMDVAPSTSAGESLAAVARGYSQRFGVVQRWKCGCRRENVVENWYFCVFSIKALGFGGGWAH